MTMRYKICAAILLAVPQLAAAQAAPEEQAASVGKTIVDADGRRLGKIVRILPGGSVRALIGERLVDIPADSVTTAGGRITTSLKRRELGRTER